MWHGVNVFPHIGASHIQTQREREKTERRKHNTSKAQVKLPWQPDCQKGKERRAADGKLWKKYISTSCVFGDSNDGFRSCMEMINTRGQGAVWHLPQSNLDASTSTWPKGPYCVVYNVLDFIGALFGSLWKQVHSFFPKHLLLERIKPFHFCPVTFPSWNFPTGRSVRCVLHALSHLSMAFQYIWMQRVLFPYSD